MSLIVNVPIGGALRKDVLSERSNRKALEIELEGIKIRP